MDNLDRQTDRQTDRQRSINSLNYLKLICAYLVVAIHTHPFSEINDTLGFIATQVIPRIAVPFFFAVSGYFYIKSLQGGKKPFVKYIKRLLTTYIVWSAIYLPVLFYEEIVTYGMSLKSVIVDYIIRFVLYGTYYHFWYFPALIFCVIIATFFYKVNKMKLLYVCSVLLYGVRVVDILLREINYSIPVLSKILSSGIFKSLDDVLLIGLPFFMVGYIVERLPRFSKRNFQILSKILSSIFILIVLAMLLLNQQYDFVVWIMLYPITICIMLSCLEHPMYDKAKYSGDCRKLSGFIYYVHPLTIILLNNFLQEYPTAVFVLACLLSTLLGLIIIKINNKTLNKILL